MIDAVFISDLHLNPSQPEITARLDRFIHWSKQNTKRLYILGDFFHAWAGDDAMDEWSESIAEKLAELVKQGCDVFLLHGNRDFLLGKRFAQLATIQLLPDPYVIRLDDTPVLLTHGDQYCAHDRLHQRFRRLTRNPFFKAVFLSLPRALRIRLVNQARQYSRGNRLDLSGKMDVVPAVMLEQLRQFNVRNVIHGHIHKPGVQAYVDDNQTYHQYVLSDWDDKPSILCYSKIKRFEFKQL